jgi:hypothetical protein
MTRSVRRGSREPLVVISILNGAFSTVSNWGGTFVGIEDSTAAIAAVKQSPVTPQRIHLREFVKNFEDASDGNRDDSTGLFFGKQTDMGTSAGPGFREPER